MEDENKKYPEGHFVGRWMMIGMIMFAGLGVPLSVATGNQGLIGIGPALGMSIGLAIGASVEEKYKKKGLIISKGRQESQHNLVVITLAIIGVVIMGIILLAI